MCNPTPSQAEDTYTLPVCGDIASWVQLVGPVIFELNSCVNIMLSDNIVRFFGKPSIDCLNLRCVLTRSTLDTKIPLLPVCVLETAYRRVLAFAHDLHRVQAESSIVSGHDRDRSHINTS